MSSVPAAMQRQEEQKSVALSHALRIFKKLHRYFKPPLPYDHRRSRNWFAELTDEGLGSSFETAEE